MKNGGLDQYGSGPSKQQQFVTAGTEWVKHLITLLHMHKITSKCHTLDSCKSTE